MFHEAIRASIAEQRAFLCRRKFKKRTPVLGIFLGKQHRKPFIRTGGSRTHIQTARFNLCTQNALPLSYGPIFLGNVVVQTPKNADSSLSPFQKVPGNRRPNNSGSEMLVVWLREMDLHHRPLGHEPSELLTAPSRYKT